MGILTDKKIVIIGGTTGIGLAAARAFIAEGARLVVVGRKQESVQEAGQVLGKKAVAISGDAIDPATAVQAIDQCCELYGRFDGLYHVAGGSGRKMGGGPLHELTLGGWNKTIELNLTGPV